MAGSNSIMVTRKDVAKRAGVTVTTVSRVYNNSGYVSEEKRKAVEKAAAELNYHPNPVAVSLLKNVTKQVLLLVSDRDFRNSYYAEVYRGAVSYAEKVGYLVALSTNLNLSSISSKMFDGVIFLNVDYHTEEINESIRVPAVSLNFGEEDYHPKFPHIKVDTGLVVELAINYLNKRGHEKIGLVMSGGSKADRDNCRLHRYLEIQKNVYGENVNDYVFGYQPGAENIGKSYLSYGVLAAEQISQAKPDCSAFICFNDEVALGLIGAFYQKGIYVPEAYSVVGIDDIPMAQCSIPPLTTIHLPAYEQGYQAMKTLVGLLQGEASYEEDIQLPLEIRERNSVMNRLSGE
jgi:LacI family repressor for deo operon, udp, cdd, tsx, nupC, and nupG